MLPLGIRGTVLKDSGKLIGDCGLHRLENIEGNPAEIAYCFARSYWNQVRNALPVFTWVRQPKVSSRIC